MAPIWDDIIPAADRAIYDAAGYGQPLPLGSRPAVIVVDVTVAFTGDRPEPILESIRRWPKSCGEGAWTAMAAISPLLTAARAEGVRVFYTHGPKRKSDLNFGTWARKAARSRPGADDPGEAISGPVAPQPGDFVLEKLRPSAFFGTPLRTMLQELGVDTVLVCGSTTSGCVRATVVDAFSHGLRVGLVAEGTFDRTHLSHKLGLFELSQKYANVISAADALGYLANVLP